MSALGLKCKECPKCDGWVKRRYSSGHARDIGRNDEHLDCRCLGCGYEWEEDCLDAREARVAALGPPP